MWWIALLQGGTQMPVGDEAGRRESYTRTRSQTTAVLCELPGMTVPSGSRVISTYQSGSLKSARGEGKDSTGGPAAGVTAMLHPPVCSSQSGWRVALPYYFPLK